ncbi:MAG: outer membrane lipoprotein carrier protein LolA [Bdellovibrionales bacterium]
MALESAPLTRADLDQTLKKYQKVHTLEVDFKQVKELRDLDMKLVSTGHLTVRPPDFMKWEVVKPSPLIFTMEGEKIRLQGKSESDEIDLGSMSQDHRRELSQLLSWLRFDVDAISAQYSIYKTGPADFRFEPKSEGHFKKIEMKMNAQGHLRLVQFLEISGDTLRIEFERPQIAYSTPNAKAL